MIELIENKEIIITAGIGLYEVIARTKITKKNWSLIHAIFKIINIVLPNNLKR